MKNLLAALALVLVGFTTNAQELITIISSSDTSVSVMEDNIYKIDNLTDSTSTVFYLDWQGSVAKVASDTNEAKYVAIGTRLITPSGLGYTINADKILEATKLTDTTSFIFYKEGRLTKKINLDISVGDLNAIINAL